MEDLFQENKGKKPLISVTLPTLIFPVHPRQYFYFSADAE